MKEEGIVKKTQEAINEKVVPAAKEGFETAQELLGKGANFVGDLLKEAGKKTEQVVETAGERTKSIREEAGKTFEKTQEKLIDNKNDAFNYFKKNVDAKKNQASNVVEELKAKAEKHKGEAVEFAKNTQDQTSGIVKAKKGKKVVKTAAGFAVLAAAAAGAYAFYKKRLEHDEAVKAEFSEKMKKWNELEGDDLVLAAKENPVKMHVRPTKVYPIGKNALLGEDIVVNISGPGAQIPEFNPDDISEPINPMEELRKKAEKVAENLGDKAKEAYQMASEKAGELKEKAEEKAGELKEMAEEKRNEIKQKADDMMNDPKLDDVIEDAADHFEEAKAEVTEKVADVADKAEDIIENKMESDPSHGIDTESLSEKPDYLTSPDNAGEEITWQEDESVLMQRTEELRNKTSEGFNVIKEKVANAKDFVVDKVNQLKPEEMEEIPEEFYTEEYTVIIHNRGNKDYFFSPMLIQRYNSKKRVTTPVPAHAEGTTLEQRIIKPGETYSGTIVLCKTIFDDAVIMFEDMLMKNSVAILLADELDEQFLMDESLELRDDLLFEGIDDDMEDYEFNQDEATQLDDLEIEEAEELDFDFSEDESQK